MKLAVSNIAWENAELAEHLALLHDLGCQGVELAPSCIWPEPVVATAAERARLGDLVSGSGLEVTGFHALLFARPDLLPPDIRAVACVPLTVQGQTIGVLCLLLYIFEVEICYLVSIPPLVGSPCHCAGESVAGVVHQ